MRKDKACPGQPTGDKDPKLATPPGREESSIPQPPSKNDAPQSQLAERQCQHDNTPEHNTAHEPPSTRRHNAPTSKHDTDTTHANTANNTHTPPRQYLGNTQVNMTSHTTQTTGHHIAIDERAKQRTSQGRDATQVQACLWRPQSERPGTSDEDDEDYYDETSMRRDTMRTPPRPKNAYLSCCRDVCEEASEQNRKSFQSDATAARAAISQILVLAGCTAEKTSIPVFRKQFDSSSKLQLCDTVQLSIDVKNPVVNQTRRALDTRSHPGGRHAIHRIATGLQCSTRDDKAKNSTTKPGGENKSPKPSDGPEDQGEQQDRSKTPAAAVVRDCSRRRASSRMLSLLTRVCVLCAVHVACNCDSHPRGVWVM